MHQTLSERWNRISLRSKITGVTVLMLTLGLLVSGIGTAAMLSSWVEQQLKQKLVTIADSSLEEYFTDLDGFDGREIRQNAADDVLVVLYNPETGAPVTHNWANRPRAEWPQYPLKLTVAEVYGANANGYRVFSMPDADGEASFRAVASLVTSDNKGSVSPVIIAISARDTQQLLAAYLTIFLGFGIGVIIVGALLTRMLVTSTFTPLRDVERTAAAIAEGDFSQRLGGATPNTEVGRLNRSLNTMLNRIDRAFRDRARSIEQMRRFVGDASHELRTPLVSVRGYAELYRMGALQSSEDVAQAMDRIEKEAIRMGLLVEDLLTLARLDETKPLELTPVDLVPLARDAALDAMAGNPGRTVTVISPDLSEDVPGAAPAEVEVAETAGADETEESVAQPEKNGRSITGPLSFAGARLSRLRRRSKDSGPTPVVDAAGRGRGRNGARTGAEPAAPAPAAPADAPVTGPVRVVGGPHDAVVLAEENKIRQVITNLMGNAMRFTATESPIEIRVSVDEAAERAVLEVIDHGEGIPPQIREKIFQRFWRADTSRTRETGGTGLGLAIVSSIIAAHNGVVDVVETPGGGATFRIALPLMGSAAAPQPVAAPES
ncbi:sensor histidine kinase [Agromyces archimandritae]|uniref:histidine kinase n=1 Tax=Agromyces archimandritae TaxID=2781962 RepID=A0A975IPH0_9MICO|nr:HAMP domain-containing sensor histidine kinase [Agromyces archimandritae]QTX03996.1 HAMP domain-containing histidine kinase [Agromyces archimandritae]